MSRKYRMNSILIGASMIFVLLAVSFVGAGPSETIAQGTNATNATSVAMLQVQLEEVTKLL